MPCAQGALGCKRLLQRVKGNEHQRKRVVFVGDENESPRLYGKRGVDQGYDGGRGSDIKEGGDIRSTVENLESFLAVLPKSELRKL